MFSWPSFWSKATGLGISQNISASPIIKGSPTPKARERKLLTIKWLGEEALVHKTKLSYTISMRLFVPFGVYEVLSRFFCCPRPCGLGCWKRVTASTERDPLSAVFVPSLTTLFFLCLSSPSQKSLLVRRSVIYILGYTGVHPWEERKDY